MAQPRRLDEMHRCVILSMEVVHSCRVGDEYRNRGGQIGAGVARWKELWKSRRNLEPNFWSNPRRCAALCLLRDAGTRQAASHLSLARYVLTPYQSFTVNMNVGQFFLSLH